MKRKRDILIIVLLALAGLVACNGTDDQLLSYQHTVQVNFYSIHTKRDTTLTNVQIWGENRTDSMLYDQDAISNMYLNLRLNNDTTTFYIKTESLTDQLMFFYRRNLEPIGSAGGITMQMVIDSVRHTKVFIDSVSITHRKVYYNEDKENLQLYVF